MNFVTVEELKVHIRMDDIMDEENYLELVGSAAESLAMSKVNRKCEEIAEMGEEFLNKFKMLTLQIAADMYAQREASSTSQLHIAPVTEALACSLRKLSVR